MILFFFVLAVFFLSRNTNPKKIIETKDIQYVEIGGQKIKVDLAITPQEQTRGLSGRVGLKDNEGMLFIFQKPGKNFFWMKEMNFPIDMIWLGDDFKVIYIKKNATPESYPEVFGPTEDTKYVLEVLSGFSEKNNLKTGDLVKFLP